MSITVDTAQLRKLVLPVFTGYSNDDYLARVILPQINVKEAHGQVAQFSADVLRLTNSAVGEFGKAVEVSSGLSWANYDCIDHFKSQFVPSTFERQFDAPISAAQWAAESIAQSLLVEEEAALATALTYTNFSAGWYATPGTKWNSAGGDPVADVNTGMAKVRTATGRFPNVLVVTPDVHLVLVDYVRASYSIATYAGQPSNEQMAAFFGVKSYYVAGASYNSAIEGQTAVLANIYGTEMCWLLYVPENASLMAPAFGYTIVANSTMDAEVSKNPRGITYLASSESQAKVLNYDAGYALYNTLA